MHGCLSMQIASPMQLLLGIVFVIRCASVHVTASSRKPIDEMAVLSKMDPGQFAMIKGLLAKQATGQPIAGLMRKRRDVEDDPAISMLRRGASRSFATEDTDSSSDGGSESYIGDSSGRRSSSDKNWFNWKPPNDDLVAHAPGAIQSANWKPSSESKDEKAVSGLLGMVAGLTGQRVQTSEQRQEAAADQPPAAFGNDMKAMGIGQSDDPNELRLEGASMSWDAIVPSSPIFKSPQANPEVSLASSSNPKVGKWLGWKPHDDDEEAAAYLGDARQAAPAPAPSPAEKSLLATSKAVMEANAASSRLGSDLASFDYDTADSHETRNSYVESLGSTYKMFAGVLPPAPAPEASALPAQQDVKQMVEEAANLPQSVDASANGMDQLSALKNMKPTELNLVKSLLAKQQAGVPIAGFRKHTDLKALFTGSSMESIMDNLSTGGSASSDDDSSDSTSRYGGASAIFQGKKNWLNWRPHNDDGLASSQMSQQPKDTKQKDENAVNGLLATVEHLTGRRVERQAATHESDQPSFVNDLNPAESWALREDAKKMSWGDIMQPEMAPVSSALQAPPAQAQPEVADIEDVQHEQEIRAKARKESWGDVMRQTSPMHQNDPRTISALQQSPSSSYSSYMSDLGLSSSQPQISTLQETAPVKMQEKSIENAYLKDLDAPIDASLTLASATPAAPPSNSYMNFLS